MIQRFPCAPQALYPPAVNLIGDYGLDILGWSGSALLVFSLLQASVLRLRVLNAVACVMLIGFNWALSVWPMVGMNAVLTAINVFFIIKMLRERHDELVYDVIRVAPADGYLQHVIRTHSDDIARFNPGFAYDPSVTHDAFLVQKGDETVGVVMLRADADTAHVLLDYVTPRFRDFTPGEFVWRDSGLLTASGFTRVVTPPGMVGAYYGRLGFNPSGESYVLDVA